MGNLVNLTGINGIIYKKNCIIYKHKYKQKTCKLIQIIKKDILIDSFI